MLIMSDCLKFDETGTIVTGYYGHPEKVSIPNGVKKIGERAFEGCSTLISVELPNSVIKIDDFAFYDCRSLTSIVIPNNVKVIGDYILCGCRSLISVKISNNVKDIKSCVFNGCWSLITIDIPNSVETIEKGAFSSCRSLTSIYVSNDNEYFKSVDGVLFSKDGTVLIAFPRGKDASEYSIPDGVKEIGNRAFSVCTSLNTIEIPKRMVFISLGIERL